MRYNTVEKRRSIKNDVINYLTDYCGYGHLTASYEVNNWIQNGFRLLSETVKEDIRRALVHIRYEKSLD